MADEHSIRDEDLDVDLSDDDEKSSCDDDSSSCDVGLSTPVISAPRSSRLRAATGVHAGQCVIVDAYGASLVRVGMPKHGIVIWETGTVLAFYVDLGSFPSKVAQMAHSSFLQAVQNWAGLRGVTFRQVDTEGASDFVLRYRELPKKGGRDVYADAFFPHTKRRKRVIYIYALSFTDGSKKYVVSIFNYELGHVLGLRHEHFSRLRERKAKRVGKESPNLVMTYNAGLGKLVVSQQDI